MGAGGTDVSSSRRGLGPDKWITSDALAHEPIIDDDTFAEVQERLTSRARQSTGQTRRATRNPYLFRGLILCGVCDRKMQGQHSHGSVYYRCRFPQEYALANRVEHPRNVIMREDVLIKPLDGWIAELFRPDRREATIVVNRDGRVLLPAAPHVTRLVCGRVTAFCSSSNPTSGP